MAALLTRSRFRPTTLPTRAPSRPWGHRQRALSTAAALDAAIDRATADPYRALPRAVVMAASSTSPCVCSGRGGYAQLPRRPTSADELARKGEPITDASIFELYSCTKLVTAITALQLVEQGRIGLDDVASDFVPALGQVRLFRRFDAEGELVLEENVVPITVRMLLTHTAGTAKASSLPPSPRVLTHGPSGFAYYTHNPAVTQIAAKLGIRPMPYSFAAEKVRSPSCWVPKSQQD